MQLTEGYKQTEVGVIPEDWEVNELNKYAELLSSKRIFEDDYVSVGIPFWRGSEVSALAKGKPISKEYFISTEKYETLKRSFGAPTKGDILVTAVGTLGNIYLVPNNAPFYFKDGNLIWLRNIKHIDHRYLKIQLLANKQQILDGAIGSSQKALTIVALKTLRIPLPPTKAEQEAIAEALSDTDAWIESLEQLIAKKRRIKEGSMQALLTGKQRLPGFSGEWRSSRLGSSLIMPATYGIVKAGEFQSSGIPMVRGGDIKNGRIGTGLPFVSSDKHLEYSRTILKENDVLISLVGYPGEAASVPQEYIGANISRAVGLLRVRDDVDTCYLVEFLNSPIGRRTVLAPSAGSAQIVVNLKELNKLKIPYPPTKAEQTAIAAILSDMDTELDALEGKLGKARKIKQGMMQELLTGKTRLVTPASNG